MTINVYPKITEAIIAGVIAGVTEGITAGVIHYFGALSMKVALLAAIPIATILGGIVYLLRLREAERARAEAEEKQRTPTILRSLIAPPGTTPSKDEPSFDSDDYKTELLAKYLLQRRRGDTLRLDSIEYGTELDKEEMGE